MKIKYSSILSFLLINLMVFLSLSARAQDNSLLSYEQAIQLGLENNLTIQQNANTVLSSEAQLQNSRWNLAPRISASSTAAQRTGNTFNQQAGEVVTGTINFFSADINASMDLFNGLSNWNNIKSSSYQLEADQAQLEFSKQDLLVQISTQYLNVLVNQQLVLIAKENLEFQKTTLNQLEIEVEVGRKADVERINQVALFKNAELELFRAQNALRNSKAALAQTMMIDPTVDFTVELPEINIEDRGVEEKSISELNDIALQNRYDYISSQMNESASLYQRKSSIAGSLPSLRAFASAGSQYNQVQGIPQLRTFDEQFFSDNRYISYGVSLNVPIFNNFRTRTLMMQQTIVYENAKLNRLSIENTIKNGVLTASLNYTAAQKQYEMAISQMEARELSQQLNTESYELGTINLLDFSQSTRDYYTAKSDLARAEVNLTFQKILLQATLGVLDSADLK